jgi:hypothetical protein
MLENLVDPALKVFGQTVDHLTNAAARSALAPDSLVQVSQPARVEPICLIDQRAQSLAYIPDVMQSLTSLFTGYYLQAVALSCNVGRVNVIKLLDRLSPKRLGWAGHLNAEASREIAMASYESPAFGYKLPDFSQESLGLEGAGGKYSDAFNDYLLKGYDKAIGEDPTKKDKESKDSGGVVKANKDLSSVMSESVNLSVGKLIEVTIEDNGAKATIPVTIRLLATILDPKTLVHILSDNSRNTGFVERYHGWKSGELRFWKDLVLCQDLIAEHRNAMIKDSSNIYADMMARRRTNAQAAALTAIPSSATASNLVVITSESAKELERQLGGRLKDFKVRKRVFDATYLMIVAVVDPEWEHITFYTNGIEAATTLSVAEIKTSNKGTGPDVMEILKAFQMGSSAHL